MAVELLWIRNDDIIEEPFDNTATVSYDFTLKNNGSSTALGVGFYLTQATLEGDVDHPSTRGTIADWYDTLKIGGQGGSPLPGFKITQNTDTTRFSFDLGANAENPIPLTIGSGTASNELAPGESVEITLTYQPVAASPARRLYVEIGITYTEE